MDQTKILFYYESVVNRAGTERILSVILNELAKYHHVTMLTAFNEGRPDGFSFTPDVIRHDLGMRKSDYTFHVARKRAVYKHLDAYLHDHPQDVAVYVGGMGLSFFPKFHDSSKKVMWFHFSLNSELLQCQDPHLNMVERVLRRRKWKRNLRLALRYDHLVVLSKKDQALWQKYRDNVHVVYNTVTIHPQQHRDYAVKRAVAVGRLTYQKGFDKLIGAWKIVHEHEPEWKLDILGEGGSQDELQRLIDVEGLHDTVRICGFCKDVASALQNYSLGVVSSNFEGFSLALVEEAASGLPLVSYDCECGPSEIIDDGRSGFLVDKVGDEKGLAEAIMKLTASEELRRQFGQEATKVTEKFSLEKVIGEWNRLIADILRG